MLCVPRHNGLRFAIAVLAALDARFIEFVRQPTTPTHADVSFAIVRYLSFFIFTMFSEPNSIMHFSRYKP